jgi:hypothetical protein
MSGVGFAFNRANEAAPRRSQPARARPAILADRSYSTIAG